MHFIASANKFAVTGANKFANTSTRRDTILTAKSKFIFKTLKSKLCRDFQINNH